MLDKWIYLLIHLDQLAERPSKFSEAIFVQLFCAAERHRLSTKEETIYCTDLHCAWEYNAIIETAYEDGLQQGRREAAIRRINHLASKGHSASEIAAKTEIPTSTITAILAIT